MGAQPLPPAHTPFNQQVLLVQQMMFKTKYIEKKSQFFANGAADQKQPYLQGRR